MIPDKGWKPMEDAPRDGTIILTRSREWNVPSGKLQVQAAQYLCNDKGHDWTWRRPGAMGTTVHSDAWMTISEFQAQQAAAGFVDHITAQPYPKKAPVAPKVEFDL